MIKIHDWVFVPKIETPVRVAAIDDGCGLFKFKHAGNEYWEALSSCERIQEDALEWFASTVPVYPHTCVFVKQGVFYSTVKRLDAYGAHCVDTPTLAVKLMATKRINGYDFQYVVAGETEVYIMQGRDFTFARIPKNPLRVVKKSYLQRVKDWWSGLGACERSQVISDYAPWVLLTIIIIIIGRLA